MQWRRKPATSDGRTSCSFRMVSAVPRGWALRPSNAVPAATVESFPNALRGIHTRLCRVYPVSVCRAQTSVLSLNSTPFWPLTSTVVERRRCAEAAKLTARKAQNKPARTRRLGSRPASVPKSGVFMPIVKRKLSQIVGCVPINPPTTSNRGFRQRQSVRPLQKHRLRTRAPGLAKPRMHRSVHWPGR